MTDSKAKKWQSSSEPAIFCGRTHKTRAPSIPHDVRERSDSCWMKNVIFYRLLVSKILFSANKNEQVSREMPKNYFSRNSMQKILSFQRTYVRSNLNDTTSAVLRVTWCITVVLHSFFKNPHNAHSRIVTYSIRASASSCEFLPPSIYKSGNGVGKLFRPHNFWSRNSRSPYFSLSGSQLQRWDLEQGHKASSGVIFLSQNCAELGRFTQNTTIFLYSGWCTLLVDRNLETKNVCGHKHTSFVNFCMSQWHSQVEDDGGVWFLSSGLWDQPRQRSFSLLYFAAFEQTVVQASWDFRFTPPPWIAQPASHQPSKHQSQIFPQGFATPPPTDVPPLTDTPPSPL